MENVEKQKDVDGETQTGNVCQTDWRKAGRETKLRTKKAAMRNSNKSFTFNM